jgi:acetate kinase
MTAAMGGLDVLVFTGGVGEHSAPIRVAACDGLGYLGVHINRAANEGAPDVSQPDRDITAHPAPVRTLIIEAREDLQIAHEVRQVLGEP